MKKKQKKLIVTGIVIVAVVVLAILIYFLIPKEITAEKLQSKLDKFPELEGKTPVKITLLTEEGLEERKKQNPSLFEEAVEGDYLIEYSDLLVLYSYKQNRIKKQLTFQRLILS